MNWTSRKYHWDEEGLHEMGTEKLSTAGQRANRVDCGEELLESCNQDLTEFFDRIVTGDETWIHQ